MRALALLAIAVGAGALLRTSRPLREPTFEERRRRALAKCRGTLLYDPQLDMFFDMNGRTGSALV